MCGIDGILGHEELDLRAYYAAHATLAHRGPDDEGFLTGGAPGTRPAPHRGDRTTGRWTELPHVTEAAGARWALGFHRLSILELTEKGHQPFAGREERNWIVFNGEIYNYRELRSELAALGHEFHTSGDTEVVSHAFDEWGPACFERFNGMWGIAVLDTVERRLTLSRDRFGVKPLYYHLGRDRLLFGSELKFLAPLVDLGLDEHLAVEYLAHARIDHGNATLHPEAEQIPPGHFATYDLDRHRLELTRYWRLPEPGQERDRPLEQAVGEFSELFDSAVDLRMRSDVPVGSLLSGGLDSSAVVGNLHSRGHFPDDGLRSFSAVYAEEEFSERRYVEAVAAEAGGLDPTFVEVSPDRVAAELADVIRAQDAPLRSVAVYCQWLLYRTVRERSPVVVLLNGQGADEAFGGYTQHLLTLLGSHAAHGRLGELARDSRWLTENRGIEPKRALLAAASGISHALRGRRPRRRRIDRPWLREPVEVGVPVFSGDAFDDSLRSNLLHSALPEYLRYEDRNSMASSLETRLPFLDYRLVEWAFSLPPELKVRRGESKRVVREATAGYVPEAVRTRTDKMGFTSPQQVWQRAQLGDWIRDGVQRVDVSLIDRDALRAGERRYASGEDDDTFFWFRAACLGWWQELRA